MPSPSRPGLLDGPPIPGLDQSDANVVHWFRLFAMRYQEGGLVTEGIAWFVARCLCMTEVLIWLGQEQDLLQSGLADLFAECADLVTEPWAGFVRWASDTGNTAQFLLQPPYESRSMSQPLPSRAERRRAQRSV